MRTFALGFVFVLCAFRAFGQSSNTCLNKLRFGFLIGVNAASEKSQFSHATMGTTMGLLAEYPLSSTFSLYPNLNLSLYQYKNGDITRDAAVLELPVYLMFKPFNTKYKPLLSIGPDYRYDLQNLNGRFFGNVALGVERQFAKFIFAPELRYAYSPELQVAYLTLHFKGVGR